METLFVTNKCAKKININGSNDVFYRYQMSQLQVKIHGKNKMVRTEFVNLKEVANQLHTDPKYIVAFIGYSMGAKFSTTGDVYYIFGHKQCEELSEKLQLFIESMIICKTCLLPELILSVDKKLWFSCKSCGLKYSIRFIDKFEAFVIKHFIPQKVDLQMVSNFDGCYKIPIPKEVIWASDLSEIEVQKRTNVLCPDGVQNILNKY
jgi:translation initiation factor 2 beta subunit (eIF-2beta)/eIF-5